MPKIKLTPTKRVTKYMPDIYSKLMGLTTRKKPKKIFTHTELRRIYEPKGRVKESEWRRLLGMPKQKKKKKKKSGKQRKKKK